MYSALDSPPPHSQFLPTSYYRQSRPWSPDPYDPLQTPPESGGLDNESRVAFHQLQRDHQSRRPPDDDGDRRPQSNFVEAYPPLPTDQFPILHSKFKREASENSVEALDLADYAKTLRARQAEDPYPAFPFAESSLSSSTRQAHRRARDLPAGYPPHPPTSFPAAAMVSRGGTFSSTGTSATGTHHTPRSNDTGPLGNTAYGRRSQRPFSLPSSPYGSAPHIASRPPDQENEIDISRFPAWSRNWYTNDTNNSSRRAHNRPQANNLESLEAYELQAGLALPQPLTDSSSRRGAPSSNDNHGSNNSIPRGSGRQPLSPFDPTYVHPQSYPRAGGAIYDDDFPSHSAPSYSNHDPLMGGEFREGIVPWSHDPPEYGQPPLDPQVRETRMRMLEKAFGTPTNSHKSRANGGDYGGKNKGKVKEVDDGLMRDENGRLIVGTPDGKGGLATQGPYVRATLRLLQVLLVVAVGAPVVWAAVALKPNPVPPPTGNPPLYILYILSPLTLILLLYLFVVRPCTVRRRYASSLPHPAANGMMVLPVPNGANTRKSKNKNKGGGGAMMFPGQKNKKGKKATGMPGGDVQVNLIVDPNAFVGLPGHDLSSSSDEDADDTDIENMMTRGNNGTMPGAFLPNYQHQGNDAGSDRQRAKRKRQKRRTLVAGLRLEEEWKSARGWVRKLAFVDGLVFVLWSVAFGYVIAGKRCPTGGVEQGYGGWCTAYNAATAASCLLCVSFAVSIFFGVKDLYASKLSPRTRM